MKDKYSEIMNYLDGNLNDEEEYQFTVELLCDRNLIRKYKLIIEMRQVFSKPVLTDILEKVRQAALQYKKKHPNCGDGK